MLQARVSPDRGSNVTELRDKRTGLSLLRQPRTADDLRQHPFLFGIPVLFPPNRIADGRFTFQYRTYEFDVNEPDKQNHIHGFVHDKPWTITTQSSTKVTTRFDAADHPDVLRQFPHRFVLELTTSVEGDKLVQTLRTTNLSDTEMPFGLGYHTTFVCSDRADVSAPVTQRWELNERNLPTGALEQTSTDIPIYTPLDDAYLVDRAQRNELVIRDHGRGIELRYWCDEHFTQWLIYTKDGRSGFVCPEPYTWITNAPNLDLPTALTGFQSIAPGESLTCTTEIRVVPLNQ